jgi:cytoskeletal protein CcmA (bactofilin family)
MAMFEKPGIGTDGVASPGTVVGANVKLTGTLKDVSDITVHGQVEGEIISDKMVTIAETAKVKGPVSATVVTIAGVVNGAVTASERLELLPSARLTGSITTTDLSIKSGALFNGKATMTETARPDGKPESITARSTDEASGPTSEELPTDEGTTSESQLAAVTMDDRPAAEAAQSDGATSPAAELED